MYSLRTKLGYQALSYTPGISTTLFHAFNSRPMSGNIQRSHLGLPLPFEEERRASHLDVSNSSSITGF